MITGYCQSGMIKTVVVLSCWFSFELNSFGQELPPLSCLNNLKHAYACTSHFPHCSGTRHKGGGWETEGFPPHREQSPMVHCCAWTWKDHGPSFSYAPSIFVFGIIGILTQWNLKSSSFLPILFGGKNGAFN